MPVHVTMSYDVSFPLEFFWVPVLKKAWPLAYYDGQYFLFLLPNLVSFGVVCVWWRPHRPPGYRRRRQWRWPSQGRPRLGSATWAGQGSRRSLRNPLSSHPPCRPLLNPRGLRRPDPRGLKVWKGRSRIITWFETWRESGSLAASKDADDGDGDDDNGDGSNDWIFKVCSTI